MAVMHVQIQALLATAREVMSRAERETAEINRDYQMEVAKPAISSGEAGKVGDLSQHVGYI